MTDPANLALVGGAALAGGAVNAIAGGGSLLTFPALVAVGLPPVTASLTNTIAMCPGYFGATVTQRAELAGQGHRAWRVLPAGALGGVLGAWLLLHTGDGSFDLVVPFLLLFAAVLVGVQEPLRAWLFGRSPARHADGWAALPVWLAGIYGGYFGAGMGVIVLAALGIVLTDTLVRLNALKQSCSLSVNVAAAVVFIATSDRITWPYVGVMAVGSLIGGAVGGRLASKIPATPLRWLIVVVGVTLAAIYFVRAY